MKTSINNIKGKTVINKEGIVVICNAYDEKNKLFFDYRKGKGRNNKNTVSLDEIEHEQIKIQMQMNI